MKRRNTPAKQMIRELLEASPNALSQDMLEAQLEGRVDRVTIYRVLNSFSEDGVAHRVVSDEGKTYFAWCRKCTKEKHRHDHAHFRCLRCLKVECLPAVVRVNLPEGYCVQDTNYWLSGLCADCSEGGASDGLGPSDAEERGR